MFFSREQTQQLFLDKREFQKLLFFKKIILKDIVDERKARKVLTENEQNDKMTQKFLLDQKKNVSILKNLKNKIKIAFFCK